MIHDEHPEVEGGSFEDNFPRPEGTPKSWKILWLPAMVYRTIADPSDEEGITRGLLHMTFIEEPNGVIDIIVDALIEAGIVIDDGHNLKALPYDEE